MSRQEWLNHVLWAFNRLISVEYTHFVATLFL